MVECDILLERTLSAATHQRIFLMQLGHGVNLSLQFGDARERQFDIVINQALRDRMEPFRDVLQDALAWRWSRVTRCFRCFQKRAARHATKVQATQVSALLEYSQVKRRVLF